MTEPKVLQLPLVPLRDMVVFPSMMAPFVVGRRASILALEATLSTSEKKIFLATQKDPKIDDPSIGEIYPIGVVATVVPTLKLDDPDKFADTLASHILITTPEKQQLLETISPYERLQKLQDFLEVEIEKINIDKRINSKVKKQMERAQKEYYLNEKIKAIHHEL